MLVLVCAFQAIAGNLSYFCLRGCIALQSSKDFAHNPVSWGLSSEAAL